LRIHVVSSGVIMCYGSKKIGISNSSFVVL